MLNRLQESDIKLLRVYYAVASCNGFTAAEPVLRMQRPNISAAIKKLEERLDLVLCHRGRGGFQLTKEGELVYQETKRIFNAFDNFVYNLKSLHDDYSGHVTIVVQASLSPEVLTAVSKAVQSTMKKFDDVHINIQTRLYHEVEHVALSGECHLVVSSYDLVKPESVMFHPMNAHHSGRLYCAKSHPLASLSEEQLRKVDLEQFSAVGMSGLASGNYVRDSRRLSVKTYSDSYESCVSAILTGHYIGLLPDYIVASELYAQQLVPVGKNWFEFRHQLYVMNGKNVRLNPVLKFCVKELTYFIEQSASVSIAA
ncbi:MAG: LysR family transcriptional regulator [Aestuariibacter sp.]